MENLNNYELSEINGGLVDFIKHFVESKALDYVIEGTIHPSEYSKEIAKRAYGSKWTILD